MRLTAGEQRVTAHKNGAAHLAPASLQKFHTGGAPANNMPPCLPSHGSSPVVSCKAALLGGNAVMGSCLFWLRSSAFHETLLTYMYTCQTYM